MIIKFGLFLIFLFGFLMPVVTWSDDKLAVAVLGFEDKIKGKEYGEVLSGLVHVGLSRSEGMVLVDREDVALALGEIGLSLGGFTSSDSAVQAGNLLGAKIMVAGSVYSINGQLTVIVRLIGNETTRVISLDVKGQEGDLSELAEEISKGIVGVVASRGNELVAEVNKDHDIHQVIQKKFGRNRDESVFIEVSEQHMGMRSSSGKTVENELTMVFSSAGYNVYDSGLAHVRPADYRVSGKGVAEFAGRRGELISVKARLEVKVIDAASGRIIAIDRESASAIDTTEILAGRKALQEAAGVLGKRLLQRMESDS